MDFDSIEELILHLLENHKVAVTAATFVVAGPEEDGCIQVTNLPWLVEKENVIRVLGGIPVGLFNDMVGIGNIIPILQPSQLEILNEGKHADQGYVAVIAPGTGLGEEYLIWDGNMYRTFPSEGGHADFGPTAELQRELLNYLGTKYSHVSYERVCSGAGILDVYGFMKSKIIASEPKRLTDLLAKVEDPVPIILNATMDEDRASDLCMAVVDMFVSILGAEAGNMALKNFSRGGVYLSGGIVTCLMPIMRKYFMKSFTAIGRFSALMEKFPVNIVMHQQPALYGTARLGLDLLDLP